MNTFFMKNWRSLLYSIFFIKRTKRKRKMFLPMAKALTTVVIAINICDYILREKL